MLFYLFICLCYCTLHAELNNSLDNDKNGRLIYVYDSIETLPMHESIKKVGLLKMLYLKFQFWWLPIFQDKGKNRTQHSSWIKKLYVTNVM